ncbi:MAG: SDR family NAD(P)-dependent oxidoreductase, partial [Acidimicrobiia bacterium]
MPLLEGKVALVTGSTQGLGEAIVRRFVDEGTDGIVVTGRNEGRGAAVARELVSAGCDAIFLRADLADYDDVMSLADRTDAHFGKLDVLVNAAALTWRGSIVDT